MFFHCLHLAFWLLVQGPVDGWLLGRDAFHHHVPDDHGEPSCGGKHSSSSASSVQHASKEGGQVYVFYVAGLQGID
jgi:hypothetical protein